MDMKCMLTILAAGALMCSCGDKQKAGTVTFTDLPGEQKVEVYVDGKLFTNFIYPDDMEKQVLNPIYTASGIEVTRGYPLRPRPFERVDHPHHVGMWLNFGDVNGLDFWNNSFAIPAERKHRYGTIKFTGIVEQAPKEGKLVVSANWVNSGDTVLLQERTTYLFGGGADSRTIERLTELTAQTDVVITENKEGLLGIRMDRAFEEPSDRPQRYTDSDGRVTDALTVNNEGVNGVYRNALGDTGGGVWSKRSPWVALRAEKDGEVITVAVIDSRENIGYPSWSHARGYGLFAANNLGGRAFDPEADELKITLQKGDKLTFKHKVLIAGDLTDEQLNEQAEY